jgi:YHYH protein
MSKLLLFASDVGSPLCRASRGGLLQVAVCSLAGVAAALPSSSCGDDGGAVAGAQPLCDLSYNAFNSSAKVQAQSVYSWSCSDTTRTVTGNGVPDHPVSQGNFATPISAQNISVSFTMTPANTGAVTGGAMNVGYAINSVKLDPGTAGTCLSTATSTMPGGGCVAANGHDPWRIEALGGAFTFGTDESNAHVQPNGQYHYHGMPEGMLQRLNKGQAMTLVAFAGDGFPIYARYGYTDPGDSSSPIKAMIGSWQKKATPDPDRPSVAIFPMGTFTQDYQFVAGSGDLDECNGRTGVTPEFPNGIYHYYITDTYPYIQRCVKGRLAP